MPAGIGSAVAVSGVRRHPPIVMAPAARPRWTPPVLEEELSSGVMCIVEIRPGRGGQDAEEFAGSIARAVSAWSVRHNQPAGISGCGTRSITLTLPRTPVLALR